MAALVFFGLANAGLGRPFLFFVPQFGAVPAKSTVLNSWRQQGHDWISYADWLILPIFVFVSSLGTLARKNALRPSELQRSVFSLLSIVLVLMYFAANLTGLYFFVERDYYTVFGIGIFYLAVAEQLHRFAEGKTIVSDVIIALIGVVVVWAVFRLGPFRESLRIAGTAFPVKLGAVALLLALVGAWSINPKFVGPSLMTLSLLLARAGIAMPPSFSASYVTALTIDAMHHRIRQALGGTLPVFWYDDPPVASCDSLTYPGKILHSVSSMFLQPGGQGFSTSTCVAEIARGAVVVIMSQSGAALSAGERGRKALGANRAPWDQFDQATPAGDIKVSILKAPSRVTDLPPWGFTAAAPGAAVTVRPAGVTIRTPEVPWFFGGELPIPATLLQDDAGASAQVHLRIRVRAGPVGVGVLNKNRTWIAQQAISAVGPADVYLAIHRLADATDIIVHNGGIYSAELADVDAVSIATFK